MKEMKTLNGYEIVDKKAREEKIPLPKDSEGAPQTGAAGQVLESAGDGTMRWMDKTPVDKTLTKEGAAADAAKVGSELLKLEKSIRNENFDLKLGTTTWFEDVSDAGAESVKKILTYFSSLIQAVVIKFDADSNTFSVNATNGAKQIENIASYVNEGGVLAGIKFHQADDVNELFVNYGAETVCAAYGDFVESYINSLPYKSKIEKVWLLNEAGVKAFSATNEEAIIALMDRVKALGYQVSTPYANAYVITETSESILESNDFISLNLYPIGSVKMQKSNISDVIYRFNREYCIIERYLSKKDLYITEFGCSSSWESFKNPPSYVSSKEGKPISLFIEGFLRSKFIGVVKGAWLWYYHDAYTYAPETLLSVKYNTEVRYGQ